MIWTPERTERLRELIEGGSTYSAAGAELGITKNAAIGQAWRKGIMEHGGTPKAPGTVCQFPSPGRCVWPDGHPDEAGFRFCAAPVTGFGLPYCPDHMARAYVRAKPAEKAA